MQPGAQAAGRAVVSPFGRLLAAVSGPPALGSQLEKADIDRTESGSGLMTWANR